MASTYQTIIIGAGPAGLMATRTLTENRIDNILCLDKKQEIGYPMQCGEGLDKHAFDTLFGGESVPFIRNSITKNTFFIHTNEGKTHERTISMPYYQIDRPAFEKWLATPLNEKIKLNTKVTHIKKTKKGWSITTPKKTYHADSVVLADGCNFTIQKQVGLIKERPHLGPCIVGIYTVPSLHKDAFSYHFFTDFAGYIWVFPKSETEANIGIGSLSTNPTNNKGMRTRLATFIKEYYPNAQCREQSGGLLPLDGAIERPVTGSLIACGDAAGFVHPFSGEGIRYALHSGIYAADTITSYLNHAISDCSSYVDRCQGEFGDALLLGSKVRHGFLWALDHMPERLPQLFKIPTQKDIIALKKGTLTTKLKLARKLLRS